MERMHCVKLRGGKSLPKHVYPVGNDDVMCRLSFLLVLSLAPRGFSPGDLVFPSP